jgi:hypothetical protein
MDEKLSTWVNFSLKTNKLKPQVRLFSFFLMFVHFFVDL